MNLGYSQSGNQGIQASKAKQGPSMGSFFALPELNNTSPHSCLPPEKRKLNLPPVTFKSKGWIAIQARLPKHPRSLLSSCQIHAVLLLLTTCKALKRNMEMCQMGEPQTPGFPVWVPFKPRRKLVPSTNTTTYTRMTADGMPFLSVEKMIKATWEVRLSTFTQLYHCQSPCAKSRKCRFAASL